MRPFGDCLNINQSILEFIVVKPTYDHFKQFERDHDLSRFHQLVRTISIQFLVDDANFFNKFNRCESLSFIQENPKVYFKSPDLFSNVKHITFLTFEDDSVYGNEIFDLLPKYCDHLLSLTIQNTNKINFEFVHRLVTLKLLELKLCFPVEQAEFMQLITLKYLHFVDIAYVVESTDSIRRDELSKFKRDVNDCLVNELKRPALHFKIEIHKKVNVGTFIRYVLKRKNSDENRLMEAQDEVGMYEMCQRASMNNQFNRFGLNG